MSKVFIAFQTNDDTRPIVEAILADNPGAETEEYPAMIRITNEGRLVVKRETIEELIGRDFDLQEMHLNLVTLTGNVDESDDEFVLSWENN